MIAAERFDPRFFDEVAVATGEVIAVEGALCHQLIVVVDGRLQARSGSCSRALVAGDAFGWEAMECRGLNEATVVALTPVRLLVMSHAQFGAATAPPPQRHFARWALPPPGGPSPDQPTCFGAYSRKRPAPTQPVKSGPRGVAAESARF